jgi:hypothetical protein
MSRILGIAAVVFAVTIAVAPSVLPSSSPALTGQVLTDREMGRLIGGARGDTQCGPVTCTGQTAQAPCPSSTCDTDPHDPGWCRTFTPTNFTDCNTIAAGWSCNSSQDGTLCGTIKEGRKQPGTTCVTSSCVATDPPPHLWRSQGPMQSPRPVVRRRLFPH